MTYSIEISHIISLSTLNSGTISLICILKVLNIYFSLALVT